MSPVRRLASSLALAAAAAVCSSGTAFAASPGLVISQVYGGGGNTGAPVLHDYIELFNRGTVDLPLSGLSLQYASATGTGAFGANDAAITPLSGTLAAGHYLLVREAAGAGTQPGVDADITGRDADRNGRGRRQSSPRLVDELPRLQRRLDGLRRDPARPDHRPRRLRHGHERGELLRGHGRCADAIGGQRRASVPAPGALTRTRTGPTTAAAPAPRNSATAPHSCTSGDAAPSVISTAPTNTQTDVAVNADVTIAFSEDVSVSGTWYSILCPTSGSHTAAVTALRADTYTLNPDTDFAPGETCDVTVLADGVSDTDTVDPPDHMAADRTFSFTIAAPARPTLIHDVQGSTDVSPKVGETVTVEGVVVGDFQAAGQFSGFYVQEEDADVDSDPATSEGIFVFSSSPVNAGDRVRVTAKVSEFGGMTELTPVSGGVTVTGTGAAATVTPAAVTLPAPALGDLERYEGMSAVFSQPSPSPRSSPSPASARWCSRVPAVSTCRRRRRLPAPPRTSWQRRTHAAGSSSTTV